MKSLYAYFGLVFFGFILIWANAYFLVSESLYFNSLSDQFTYDQIQELLDKGKKWEWLGYVLIPLIYLIKCSLVALCLSIGLFLFINDFLFKKMFTVAVFAEFVFIVPAIIKLLWFLFVQTDYTLRDLQLFYPLSAISLFDNTALEPWLMYPLQVLNVFEIVYWVILAWGISREFPDFNLSRSMNLVATSYGSGLLIWIAVVMFASLTYG